MLPQICDPRNYISRNLVWKARRFRGCSKSFARIACGRLRQSPTFCYSLRNFQAVACQSPRCRCSTSHPRNLPEPVVPRREDIKKILLIGSGPIIIGQACEFDYSGTQACKALREEGYEVVLINSNPATIMTDPSTADATYIEPLTWQMVEKVIIAEKPDALLPTLGGQTGLNLAMDLDKRGILKKHGVELIGAKPM